MSNEDLVAAFDEYYGATPSPVPDGNETPERSRALLEAVYHHAIDKNSVTRFFLDNRHQLITVSKNIWAFYLTIRAAGERTPAPTPESTPGSSPVLSRSSAARAPATRKSALAARTAQRDNHRCCATGLFDFQSHGTPSWGASHVGAHILPFSLCNLREPHGANFDLIMSVFAPSIRVDRSEVDDITNMITLTASAHEAFGSFRWIVDILDGEWRIQCMDESWRRGTSLGARRYDAGKEYATMHSHTMLCTTDQVDSPNPDFLRIHAHLARILYMSGRAEEFYNSLDGGGGLTTAVDVGSRAFMAAVADQLEAEGWSLEIANLAVGSARSEA